MAILGRLLIDIAANTSQLKTDLDQARRELGSFKGTVEGAMGSLVSLGKNALKLAGLGLTFREIAVGVKSAVNEFSQAERQSLRLDAVLRATGNTAGISAGKLKDMAESLSRSSLFDDKSILAAISQLETFDNISGATLKQAIRLSVDLASLWDGDVSSAAYALGKALQSPTEAASLLGKAHVKLTAEERRAIDEFVKLGDVAGEQGVILKAFQDRVGGTAAGEAGGLAGAFHRLALNIGEAKKALAGWVIGGAEELLRIEPQKWPAWPDMKKPRLSDLVSTGDQDAATAALSKEIGNFGSLAAISRLGAGDIGRLQQLERQYTAALREGNLTLEARVQLTQKLKAIQDLLEANPGSYPNRDPRRILRPPRLTAMAGFRFGATPEDEAATREAVRLSRLSSAMIGVGGEPGPSPLRDDRTAKAAAIWRETWVNTIRSTQEAFANFFDSIGQEGFNLVNLFKNIAQTIRHTLSELASQQVINLIFGYGGVLAGGRGPGGQTVGSVAPGNGTQSGPGAGYNPSVVHVHQNVTFAPSFIDGASGAAWLKAHSATIAGVMTDAVGQAPAIARYIVAQGTR